MDSGTIGRNLPLKLSRSNSPHLPSANQILTLLFDTLATWPRHTMHRFVAVCAVCKCSFPRHRCALHVNSRLHRVPAAAPAAMHHTQRFPPPAHIATWLPAPLCAVSGRMGVVLPLFRTHNDVHMHHVCGPADGLAVRCAVHAQRPPVIWPPVVSTNKKHPRRLQSGRRGAFSVHCI